MKHLLKTLIQYFLCIAGFFSLNSATASPPFIIDDPEPTDYKHIELYLFSTMDRGSDATGVQLPGIEIDWGFAPNWQFSISVPIAGNLPNESINTFGMGDLETGITYRFIQETDKFPQIAIAPVIDFPTGSWKDNLGNGRAWVKLPIWLKKSWGAWGTYGGGGYAINSARGKQNYTFAGWVLQRQLNEKIALGCEVYTQGADSVDGRSYTIVNFGGSYNLSKHFSFLLSMGHSIIGEEHTIAYVGIHWVS